MSQIVVVNVSETEAGTPPSLQSMAAMVSHGGTTLAAGTSRFLATEEALAALLVVPAAVSAIAWSAEVVTAATTEPHGFTTSDVVEMTLTGFTPSGYNGTFPCTITGASGFTYPLASDPGAESVLGTYIPLIATELAQMNATWWEQGNGTLGLYVLELGPLGDVAGIAALAAYLVKYPNTQYVPGASGFFYVYMVSRLWASQSTYVTLVESFAGLNKMTYFATTMTGGNYTSFPATSCKAVIGEVEAASIGADEFSVAATAFDICNLNPSSASKATNLCYAYQYGVTPYPVPGNQTLLALLEAAGVNVVGTGSEGGQSTLILEYGTTMDTNSLNWWYSIDWLQLNANQTLSNAVINGSNDPEAPLYYDQQGINTLQAVLAGTCSNGISYGLILGSLIQTELDPTTFANNVADGDYAGNCVVNAVPLTTYVTANPSNYKSGIYGGFSVAFTPQLGFRQIIVNINATQFA